MQNAISLNQQLKYYKEYQNKVVRIAAGNKANFTSIISDAIYLVGAGSSDFLQNYYIDPLLYKVYTPNQFSDILMQSYATFIQVDHNSSPYLLIKERKRRFEIGPLLIVKIREKSLKLTDFNLDPIQANSKLKPCFLPFIVLDWTISKGKQLKPMAV